MPTFTVYANLHLPPPWSHLAAVAVGLGSLGLLAFCARARRAALAAADEARAAQRDNALREGARFVAGRVEYAEGERVALRVTLWQNGSEERAGNAVKHRWLEVDRGTEARPFYVRRGDGARVRVEPGDARVLLVDALEQTEFVAAARRGKRAELTTGEQVVVEGSLARGHDPEARDGDRGYRSAGEGWVLRPREGSLVASTEGLARRHELRARAFGYALGWSLAAVLVAQLALLSYSVRALAGRDVAGVYAGKVYAVEHGGNRRRHALTHTARALVPSEGGRDELFTDAISRDVYDQLPHAYGGAGRGDAPNEPQREPEDPGANPPVRPPPPSEPTYLMVRWVPAAPVFSSLGAGSSVFLPWLAGGLAALGFAAWHVRRVHRYRRWYERALDEEGTGPLGEPTGERFEGSPRAPAAKPRKRGSKRR